MKFIIISAFDPLPEDNVRPGRFWNFARQIENTDHELVWITSQYSHIHKKFRLKDSSWNESELKHTRIIKINTISYQQNISVRRLINHAQFGFSVLFKLRKLIWDDKPDAIVCATPPLLAPFFAACLGRRYSVPVVIDIIDLWPEAFGRFVKNRFFRNVIFFPFKVLANWTARLSSAMTGVSDDYVAHFVKAAAEKPAMTIHLGHSASGLQSEIRTDWNRLQKINGQRWVTYVGTVSNNYDLGTVLRAASTFPDVRFLIVGKGENLPDIQRDVMENGLVNVVVTGEVPYHDLANILFRSDVGLVTVNNDAWIRFPYKANDYLVAGLPFLTNITGGEIERLLAERRIGEVYREGDVSDFVAKLTRLLSSMDKEMKDRVRQYAAEHCDSDQIYKIYLDWVSGIARKEAM